MRDFSWKYFAMTGDVDAYLLYKEAESESVLAAASVEEEAAPHEEDE
ncbi:hypothetical protein PVOR_11064 [Paenibacillus vortex V453]|jgi:hypothetical protein|uniref:YqzL family protein n=1 Tax=Paenibacillus vortex V453 TaxID=715225 RepID=A0A2R9SXC1_9BACL|nr:MULTISPECIES: YqzL family protein [Paenibacillus]AVV59633.1 YqzL family protein [Paenibacillus glucanolyticus]AWP28889.1 YqzL family protein [Paenibacillus sp. Cedars]EFU42059.1 hypothetical protein PVOR_11064 [Paenibacillus vortex V453]ETT30328.1 hypothetical protein C169_28265 [Paenibacillus sp. FSL R5-808]MPY19600.1 YqzL family protein [Paenibacillus glucanolyticus]